MMREALSMERLEAMGPEEAAAHLLARRVEGLTAQEEALLAQWRAADIAHERAFLQADRAWGLFDDAGDHDLLEAMRAHALEPRRRERFVWQPIAAIAASILLLAGAFWLFAPQLWQSVSSPGDKAIRYLAERGPVKEIILPDGSRMTLDADSAALGYFTQGGRRIELVRGRAFFAVKPDHDHPFTVEADGQQVTAVGTQFDVDHMAQRLTVTLVEGRVTIGPRDASPLVTLNPGQQFIKSGSTATVRTLEQDAPDPLGWRRGLLDFEDETLADAVAQVNRYSRQQIVVRDPQTARLRISGQFRAGDGERFARTMEEVHPVHLVRQGDTIILAPAQ